MADSKETKNTDPSAAQLLNQLPPEWQQLAKEFQRQNQFYQQFLDQAQSSDDLSGQVENFWTMPSSMGFLNPQLQKQQDPWFQSLFEFSKSADTLGVDVFQEFSREVQSFSESIRHEIMNFQQAVRAMSQLQQDMGEKAQGLFLVRLATIDRNDPEQLCRAWLQAGEEAFQGISQGDEFTRHQSALMNSVSHLKRLQSDMANRFSATFGLPNQHELSELRKGLHDLRMTFAEYRDQSEDQILTLTKQLQQARSSRKKSTTKRASSDA